MRAQGAGLAVGHETVVGPGPAPPMLSVTEVGGLMVRAGHKRYFFDAGSNAHGQFVRITEVGLLYTFVSFAQAPLFIALFTARMPYPLIPL